MSEGQRLANEGMQLALFNSRPFYQHVATTLHLMKATGWKSLHFTSDDIRAEHQARNAPAPTHPNAWGAAVNTAKRHGYIVATGAYRKTKRAAGHARALPVYEFPYDS